MSIKISKIGHSSFTFKLNNKKKVLLKKFVWRAGSYKKKIDGGEVWSLRGGLKIFKKGSGLTRKGGEKIEGGC